jgi:hypothetical protein
MKKPNPNRVRKPMALRTAITHQAIVRLLTLGYTVPEIARKLRKSVKQIRYQTGLQGFQDEYAAYKAEFLKGLDRKTSTLIHGALYKAVRVLLRYLRHPDPWVRDSAAEKLLKINGRLIERVALDLSGSVDVGVGGSIDHQHQHNLAIGIIPPEQMSDEVRDHLRAVLALTRPSQPSAMLSKIQNGHTQETTDAR